MDNQHTTYMEYLRRKSSGKNIQDDEYMFIEYLRIESYLTYPMDAQASTTRLAKSGLFYQGRDDEVRCFSCKGTLRDWTLTQSPDERHRSSHPECHFMLGLHTDNIPFETEWTQELPKMLDTLSIKIKPEYSVKPKTVASPEREYSGTEKDDDGINLSSANHLIGNIPNSLTKDIFMFSPKAIPCGNDEVDGAVGTGTPVYLKDDHKQQQRVNDYRKEEDRLKSFLNTWSANSPRTPEELASAGFYFTGDGDRVKCAFCSISLRNWDEEDEALNKHVQYSPHCPFIRGEEVSNMPRPKRPDMVNESARMQTYLIYPTESAQSPKDLAVAGFYYTGYADNVTCFFCDGGLRNWEQEDDVWASHARWFPKCGFVKKIKGEAYIEQIIAQLHMQTALSEKGNGSHLIGLDEIEARMDTPSTRTVLDMGYDRDLVKKVITKRLRTTGDDFPSAMDLLDSVFAVEDKGINGTFFDPMATTDVTNETGDQNSEENELATLRAEKEEQRDTRMCKICSDNDACIVFLPCGHLVTCSHCASAVRHCPVCRKTIKGTVQARN